MRIRWTPQRDAQLTAAYRRMCPLGPKQLTHDQWATLGEECGASGVAASIRASRLGLTKGTTAGPSANSAGESAVPSEAQGNGDSETRVGPLGQALSESEACELFQVDLTRWEVVKLTHNIWEVGQKGPDGEPLTTPLCQTTLHLKRIAGAESLVALTDTLLASLTQAAPSRGPFIIKSTHSEHLLELDAFDLHLGKLAWSPETGGDNYDLGIASRDFREAVEDILHKASMFKLGRALFPIGNDLLHTDNLRSETTAGTRVDSDSRYHKMFESAVTEMRWGIDRLKTVSPVVEVKVLPGNHDRLGAYTVGRVLEAVYEKDPRVQFDNSPRLRKYAKWGKTLIGYTHGNEEKQKDLPLIMAQECAQWWAETVFRLWRGGHLHTFKKTMYVAGDSLGGVEYRTIRSLSAADSWHAMKGFVGGRRAIEGFVHHIEDGEVGAFVSRLPQREAA